MRNWKTLAAYIGAALLIIVIAYVAFYFIFLDLFVDLWWFRSLEFEGYYWLRLLYRFFLSGGVTLLFFCIFFFHFWVASRYLGLNPKDEVLADDNKRQKLQNFANNFKSGSFKIYTPLSFILAVAIALPFYFQWESAILYFFGSPSGVTESVYGNDTSFYMFSYPVYLLIQKELLVTAVLLLILVACLYWIERKFAPTQNKELPLGAKVHLTILVLFVVMYVVWGFMLDRFSLLYVDRHEPVFFGPGFVEIRYLLPLIWLSIISFVTAAVASIVYIFSEKHRSLMPIGVSFGAFLLFLGLQNIQFIPDMLNAFIVAPNPVKTEKIFMQHNIDATLAAYDLKHTDTIAFDAKLQASQDIENWAHQQHLENIPVWDREHLSDGYRQLQGLRAYYSFPGVDEDRYFLHGHQQQVNLAAREINISKLPKEAQNWENRHLRYTHGYGAVITPAAQDAAKPIIWYLRDLNLHSDVGFKIKKPDIYYGMEDYHYAIVPNKLNVVGLSGADSSFAENSGKYEGKGGIPIRSFFRKMLFSNYFQETNIFLSPNVSRNSKMRMRRNIVKRINKLAPYLHLDKDPYLVVTGDRFFWIQDAYTLSNKYPIAKPAEDEFLNGEHEFNYIRNSVKITVDAYDGTTRFYISDPSDAIIQAYDSAYPGVFRNLSKMPAALQAHLRYPRDIFELQMKVFAKYHQKSPELFYEQAETWQFANVEDKPVLPYYITMDFGNCNDKEEFVMINPMTPINRDNLSMIGIAGILDKKTCSSVYSPHISIYNFNKDIQVNGPAQVDALIDQSPEISAQFTLWDQHGSKVVRGRMIILPMGNSILYVQPIYLISTKTKIPELTRVIVSIENEVVMDKTLHSAFNRLRNNFVRDQGNGISSAASGLDES